MDIRKWLGYDTTNIKFTNVDLKLNEVMATYKLLFEKLLSRDITQFSSESFLEGKKEDSLYGCLECWLSRVGKTSLVDLGGFSYSENSKLVEELQYINFILKSELDNVEENKEDVVVSIFEITAELENLLLVSSFNLELSKMP